MQLEKTDPFAGSREIYDVLFPFTSAVEYLKTSSWGGKGIIRLICEGEKLTADESDAPISNGLQVLLCAISYCYRVTPHDFKSAEPPNIAITRIFSADKLVCR